MSHLCRTCAKDHLSINVCNLFDKSAKSKEFLEMFETIAGLELCRLNNMPDLICDSCQFELERAFEFRLMCIQAQKTLQEPRDDTNLYEIISRSVETVVLADVLNELPIMDELSDKVEDDEVVEEELSDKSESDEISDKEVEEMLNKVIESDVESNDFDGVPTTKTKEIKEAEICNEMSSKPKKGARVTRYICETCGQKFSGRGAFEGHTNRHFGINPFECDLCPQKFNAKSNLNRHKLKHAGIQPYPCRYCDRRFLDYYLRVRHERMHNNIRPFKCTFCDKAFTTNPHLKHHILTHTKERPYSCEPCNKTFAFKKNLSFHYKSVGHKRIEEELRAAKSK